ncbi:MAG: helix-turn-helix domain-containing protein [Candidatus Taylorbacteria bacterium]
MTIIDEKILIDIGLTKEQSRIYIFLLENGLCNARVISLKTNLGRALCYKVLTQLVQRGIITKRDDLGKISMFFPVHPSRIRIILEEEKQRSDQANVIFNDSFGMLSSKFNLLSGKPNIRFLEGLEGLKEMYGDILAEGKDIKLIRSPLDHQNIDTANVLRSHIEKQAKMGIKVKLIGPKRGDIAVDVLMEKDKTRNVTRRTIPEGFLIPSQIIIYGDKVSITDFKGGLIITIIENPAVRETFEKMFDYMFDTIESSY